MNQAHAQGGNATIHDRTALLVAIAAFGVALVALAITFMSNEASRDRDQGLKDDIIKIEGQLEHK